MIKLTKQIFFRFAVLTLAVTIPVYGRFACGIVIALFFNVVVLTGTLGNYAVTLLHIEKLHHILIIYITVWVTVFFKQLLILFSPLLALMLGFSLYITAFAAYRFSAYANAAESDLAKYFLPKMKQSALFSAVILAVFFLRELLGSGSISFPTPDGIYELAFPFSDRLQTASLWTLIPGTVILVALLLGLATYIYDRRYGEAKNGTGNNV